MWEEGEFHRNMMRHHEENQRREQEAQNRRNYNTQGSGGIGSKIKSSGWGIIILVIGGGLLIERYGNLILGIFITVVLLVIAYFIFKKIKKMPSNQPTYFYLGKDSKGRSVYKSKNSNGTSYMCKMVESGKLEIDIKDFEAVRIPIYLNTHCGNT